MREISSFIGARPPLGGANTQSKKYILHSVSAFALSTMPRLGDADRVCFANRSIPALRTKPKYSQQKKQKIYTSFRRRTGSTHARRTYICGRADNACTNLLGSFVRYVRTRGIAEVAESAKLSTYSINPVPHALATHG